MRVLTNNESRSVNGGNPAAAAALAVIGAYYTGRSIGESVQNYVGSRFSMSTGTAAYYTFNGK